METSSSAIENEPAPRIPSAGPPSEIKDSPSARSSLITHFSSLEPHHTPRISRHLTIPREGWAWLILTTFFLGTGLNKGINLLTFLGMIMTATWLLHLVWAGSGIRYLELRNGAIGDVFAQTPFFLTLELRNRSRRSQSGIRIENQLANQIWSYFVPPLVRGGKISFKTEVTLPHRGIFPGQVVRIRCGFPFGLVERSIRIVSGEEFVVFPRRGQLHRGKLRRMLTHASPSVGRARTNPRRHPAAQSDFHGLRAFRSGDSPHWIHWRTTARLGELMVREFEETPNDNLTLVLDAWLTKSQGNQQNRELTSEAAKQRLEDVICLAATICWDWCQESGNRFALGVADQDPLVLTGESGPDLRRRLLRALAGVAGDPNADVIQLVALMRPILPPGPILVLTTSPGNLQRTLEREFHRPVTCIHVPNLAHCDFFEC
jgi:uncharacterized protein (DUF58 family)